MEKIGVCLRIRPINQKELAEKEVNAWKIVNNNQVQLTPSALKHLMLNKKNISNYEFTNCFDTNNDNYLIFQQSLRDVVLQCLEGINATVFMYGQTGSGKTFTMLGGKKDELQKKSASALQEFIKQSFQRKEFNDIGILIYSLMEIFKEINKEKNRQFELKCSYYEIYNENIYDLLRNQQDFSDPLPIGVDLKNDFIVKGLTQVNVTTLEEVIALIHKGEKNRHYAETILNHQSSRSHTIFKFHVSAYYIDEEFDVLRCSTEAIVNFIDLAGSEKISNHYQLYNEGKDRIKESQSINKSLFFLTRVIALKTQKVPPAHIPFRNSVLTKLMKSFLTGNFRTIIMLCITPALSQYEQTQSALHFGISAQLIENKVTQNVAYDFQEEGIESLIEKIRSYEQTIQQQQQTIRTLQNQVDQKNSTNSIICMIYNFISKKRSGESYILF